MSRFCAQDGVTVSFAWEGGKLTACTLEAAESTSLRVLSDGLDVTVQLEAGVPCELLV